MHTRSAAVLVALVLATVLAITGCATEATPRLPGGVPPAAPSAPAEGDEEPVVTPAPDEESPPRAPDEEAPPTAAPGPVDDESAEPPAPTPLHAPGDTGEAIRGLQHRLLQIQWFEGPITDSFGEATQAAVEGFQAKRGLPVTGAVDEATWAKLLDMTREPTHDEMYNVMRPGPALFAPGSKGDDVKELQARLRQIGWYSGDIDGVYGNRTTDGVSGFQAKRGFPVTGEVDQRTLDKVHAMTRRPTTDELNNIFVSPSDRAMRLDERCLTGRAVCISKKARKLAWVVDGNVQMQMDVRFGSQREPTREGTFAVQWKSRDHVSSLYDSAMPFALFFSGGQAVHYSSDFAARGYSGASHGCVNVRDRQAVERLFDLARVGDKVIVYSD